MKLTITTTGLPSLSMSQRTACRSAALRSFWASRMNRTRSASRTARQARAVWLSSSLQPGVSSSTNPPRSISVVTTTSTAAMSCRARPLLSSDAMRSRSCRGAGNTVPSRKQTRTSSFRPSTRWMICPVVGISLAGRISQPSRALSRVDLPRLNSPNTAMRRRGSSSDGCKRARGAASR